MHGRFEVMFLERSINQALELPIKERSASIEIRTHKVGSRVRVSSLSRISMHLSNNS
uniref:Uncharacterized protein n=1 Tax=Picea glauca TaxID=3330 RepID=A0A101LTY4_PICGL|nr:hypothetical protein ABT39_MTgene3398 [Picea glauca]